MEASPSPLAFAPIVPTGQPQNEVTRPLAARRKCPTQPVPVRVARRTGAHSFLEIGTDLLANVPTMRRRNEHAVKRASVGADAVELKNLTCPQLVAASNKNSMCLHPDPDVKKHLLATGKNNVEQYVGQLPTVQFLWSARMKLCT